MPLTDTAIRNLKTSAKPQSVADERGLSLHIQPNGSKWWRFRYRFNDKAKMLSLGVYPDVGLKEARERREDARKLLANGIDPGENRKVQKAAKVERSANSFEVIAREWFSKHLDTWAKSHADNILARLENDVFPWLGGKAIAEITAPDVLSVMRRIDARGARYTALRAKGNISMVMRYAIATGRAERDPCPDLRGAIPKPSTTNFASITTPDKVAELLRAIDGFGGTFVVQCALRLAPMLFVRPGELRRAEWASIDLDKSEWGYFVSKTKTDHLVPLSSQAVAILTELHALTGQGRYVFPGARGNDRSMSEAAINAALRRMGYDTKTEITGHGFRAMARTILHEELHQKPEVIEHQLAHKVSDTLGTAYNRTKFLKERKAMMQLWADYLDKLKAGADVIPLHGSAA
jgi:integrase